MTAGPTAAGHVETEVDAARAMLAGVLIGGRGAKTGYLRTTVFGPAWADVNGNGCRTRDDILSRDLVNAVRGDGCAVTAGVLPDPYTGNDITFDRAVPGDIQIDHVVPLGLAWQLGAPQWSQEKRVVFANDPANLLAVDGPANMQKGDSGLDSWLPPNKAYRCTYAIRFTRVVSAYALRLTPSMRDAITTQLDNCESVEGSPATVAILPVGAMDGAKRFTTPAPTSPSPAETGSVPAESPSMYASASGEAYYSSCTAVRVAGAAPLHAGTPGYRTGLDRDRDGTACE